MLLTFSGAVSIYQVANHSLVAADVISGHWQGAQSRETSAQLHIVSLEPMHVAALQSCQDAAEHIINSWRWVQSSDQMMTQCTTEWHGASCTVWCSKLC